MKRLLISAFLFIYTGCIASPLVTTPFIRIDQFGYLCNSRKVAVIIDPQMGYNAADAYLPGTGTGQYQLRRWDNDAVVFTGTLTAWNNGATHVQSGDRGWRFDFSAVTQTGSYYVYDAGTGAGSYRFEIGSTVYTEVLKQACRTYYYQRCNFAKVTPYADAKWTDAASFEGALQDHHARSRWDKNNAATEKDVSGGWFDAGDLNKYVTFTVETLSQLLETYRQHPAVFTENLNLPESGNGIPDILDEVKYEIDWLKRMQDATGTNGLMLKVGVDIYNIYSPPSSDVNNRYYLPECTSATLSGAAVFALAANIYRSLNIPSMTAYANDLQTRAVNAWTRAQTTTSNFTVFQTDCDDQDIKSGDADENASWQKQCAITAAVYLYEATGAATYKNFVETNYNSVEPVGSGWWGPYRIFIQKALLRYTQLSGVSVPVATVIRNSKQNTVTGMSLPEYNNETDLYRAYMPDAQYTWESNMPRSGCGVNALDYVHYGISSASFPQYRELSEQYLHWLHGVNPEGIVMLSNMYAFGADSSANEIYHTWFGDGTIFDNAKTSPRGPAPGFVTGGPNREFSVSTLSPPANQPPQKAYKDWNTGWDGSIQQSSYEITEPAIYCQAMYIGLLAAIIDNGSMNCSAIILPVENTHLNATAGSKKTILQWQAYEGQLYDLQRSVNGDPYSTLASFTPSGSSGYAMSYTDDHLLPGICFYRLVIRSADGDKKYSNTVQIRTAGRSGFSIRKDALSNTVILQSDKDGNAQVKIFGADGRQVESTTVYLRVGEPRPLNMKNEARGYYWIEVSNKTDRMVEKLLW